MKSGVQMKSFEPASVAEIVMLKNKDHVKTLL